MLFLSGLAIVYACQSHDASQRLASDVQPGWVAVDSAPPALREFIGNGVLVVERGSERVGCPRVDEKRTLSVVSVANWEFRETGTDRYAVRVRAAVIGQIELLAGGYKSYRFSEAIRTDTSEFEVTRNSEKGWSASCRATESNVQFQQVNDPGMYVNPEVLLATTKRLKLVLGAKT